MSLEHLDDRRKALGRRQREMARAAKVLGPEVRNMSTHDPVAKVQPAKLLVANVQESGCFGRFLAQLSVKDENGNKHRVVREVSVRDSLAKLSTADLLVGWTISELDLAMGAAESDDRLRRRTSEDEQGVRQT